MPFNLRGPELLVLLFLIAIIVGVVLLIVWLVKVASRSSTPSAIAPDASRPAGWYPVPDGSGRVAWWDGEQWADQPSPRPPS